MLEYVAIFYICFVVNLAATAARLVNPTHLKGLWHKLTRLQRPLRNKALSVPPRCTPPTTATTATTNDTLTSRASGDDGENTNKMDASCGASAFLTEQELDRKQQQSHRKLLYLTYLPVYLSATMADWLQGPYKYALYSAYGYNQADIATLFVAGFGSGMVLGSLVGGYADTMGRRKLTMAYCVAYSLSVACKHARPFSMLLMGRVMGGISTSLLYSVFDAWLIKAHSTRGLTHLVSSSLSVATYGSSVVAILSGILANAFVSRAGKLRPMFTSAGDGDDSMATDLSKIIYKGGYLVPFDLTVVPLILCGVLARILWEENYGDKEADVQKSMSDNKDNYEDIELEQVQNRAIDVGSESGRVSGSSRPGGRPNPFFGKMLLKKWFCGTNPIQQGARTVWDDANILTCCIISSLFEGSMYVFIFLWTPTLVVLEMAPDIMDDADQPTLPLGYIFATFMVCCMVGTTAFSYYTPQAAPLCLVYILALSAISCLFMAISPPPGQRRSFLPYMGMLLFEACVGAYYPAMGTVKSTVVPENQRAAIYNVFRLPLNLIVLINLAMLGNLTHVQSFLLCGTMLSTATVLQYKMNKRLSCNSGLAPDEELQPLKSLSM